MTRNFDVFFDLRLNKLLSKQSRRWLFETPSRSLCVTVMNTKGELCRRIWLFLASYSCVYVYHTGHDTRMFEFTTSLEMLCRNIYKVGCLTSGHWCWSSQSWLLLHWNITHKFDGLWNYVIFTIMYILLIQFCPFIKRNNVRWIDFCNYLFN